MNSDPDAQSDFDAEGASDQMLQAGGQPVSNFVSDDVITLASTATLRDAAKAIREQDVSIAVVSDGDGISGVISERDIVKAVAAGTDLDATTLDTLASGPLKWATVTVSVDDVAEEMLETYVRHILVANDDGSLAGVVSMRDLLTAYLV